MIKLIYVPVLLLFNCVVNSCNSKNNASDEIVQSFHVREDSTSVQFLIKEALITDELFLRALNLDTIPNDIFKLDNLKILDLGFNNIKVVPPEIGDLRNLEYLSVSNNYIRQLPNDFSKLKKLEEVILFENEFDSVPKVLCEIETLRVLNMGNNSVQSVPNCVGKFSKLEVFNVSNDELDELDESIISEKIRQQIEKDLPANCDIRW